MKNKPRVIIGPFAVPIILSILRFGDDYGYKIMHEVRRLSNNRIKWREASIYPVLKMMEARGMVKSYWKVQSNERPRKYYTILEDGQKQLEQARDEVAMVNSILSRQLSPTA